jgi:inosine/xanthosine triphosphatase
VIEIVLASHNPIKAQAALLGFQRMFPDEDFSLNKISAPSGLPDQPMNDTETLAGAFNRAQGAAHFVPRADYWVGIEGGVEETSEGELAAFAWVVVLSPEGMGRARSGAFILPWAVSDLVRQGKELGEADDLVFNRINSKQETGSVGLLTSDVLTRLELYTQAVILALIPFKNQGLYW